VAEALTDPFEPIMIGPWQPQSSSMSRWCSPLAPFIRRCQFGKTCQGRKIVSSMTLIETSGIPALAKRSMGVEVAFQAVQLKNAPSLVEPR